VVGKATHIRVAWSPSIICGILIKEDDPALPPHLQFMPIHRETGEKLKGPCMGTHKPITLLVD
jgi:hypothetical protein